MTLGEYLSLSNLTRSSQRPILELRVQVVSSWENWTQFYFLSCLIYRRYSRKDRGNEVSGLLVSYVCIPNCRSGWRALAIRVELILLGVLGQGQGWKGRDCCTSYFHGNTLASESVTSEAKMEIGWDWGASSASETSPDNLLVHWRGNQPCPSLPTHGTQTTALLPSFLLRK